MVPYRLYQRRSCIFISHLISVLDLSEVENLFLYGTVYNLLHSVIWKMIRRDRFDHRHLFHSKNICPLLFLTKVNICPLPLPHNIFRLFVILSLTQLYRYTPEIFLFSTATFKYKYRVPLRRIRQEYSAKVAFSIFQSMKRR